MNFDTDTDYYRKVRASEKEDDKKTDIYNLCVVYFQKSQYSRSIDRLQLVHDIEKILCTSQNG